MSEKLSCSEAECKRRCMDVDKMSMSELEKYNVKCCNCGNWIIKTNAIANKTYQAVSNRWADEFMKNLMKNK